MAGLSCALLERFLNRSGILDPQLTGQWPIGKILSPKTEEGSELN